jgi:hypothetical protein
MTLKKNREYGHVSAAVARFMGDKKAERVAIDLTPGDPPRSYPRFFDALSSKNTEQLISSVWKMTSSEAGQQELGRIAFQMRDWKGRPVRRHSQAGKPENAYFRGCEK